MQRLKKIKIIFFYINSVRSHNGRKPLSDYRFKAEDCEIPHTVTSVYYIVKSHGFGPWVLFLFFTGNIQPHIFTKSKSY